MTLPFSGNMAVTDIIAERFGLVRAGVKEVALMVCYIDGNTV